MLKTINAEVVVRTDSREMKDMCALIVKHRLFRTPGVIEREARSYHDQILFDREFDLLEFCVIAVAYVNGVPAGTAIIKRENSWDDYLTIMVYVKKNYRRAGIGTKLVENAKAAVNEEVCCCRWNGPSDKFFNSLHMEQAEWYGDV